MTVTQGSARGIAGLPTGVDVMKAILNFLLRNEEGAVTVDWVVLTGAIVGLSIGVISIMANGPVNIGNAISTSLANQDVAGVP
jgi:Flp pilus assembly pilin Flp